MESKTTHRVYEHPDGRREVIKVGFSWPAFCFGPFWAWRKGMVVLGFALFALLQLIPLVLVGFVGDGGIVVDLIVTIVILAVIGDQGNAWLGKSALSRGFTPVSASARTESGTERQLQR